MSEQAKPKSVTQLESIRVAATAGIFLYHVWSIIPAAGTDNPFGPILGRILAQGWAGVIVFNVITGFVLSLPYFGDKPRETPGFMDFMRTRFARICPNYYLSLAFFAAVELVMRLFGTGGLLAFLWSVVEHLVFIHTLDPANFFGIVPAYWWMGLLAQWYVFFPFYLKLVRRFGVFRTTLAACLGCWGLWLALSLAALGTNGAVAMIDYLMYYNLPARLPEFALGMALASWYRQGANAQAVVQAAPGARTLGLAGGWVFLMCVMLAKSTAELIPLPLLHFYFITACLGLGFLLFSLPVMAKLGARPWVLKAAGTSFSFYLIHQPIIATVLSAVKWLPPFWAFLVVCLAGGAATWFASLYLDKLTAKLAPKPAAPAQGQTQGQSQGQTQTA